jgi:hypothetical protein
VTLAPRPLTKGQVADQWAGIDTRLSAVERSRRRRPALAAVGVLLVAGVALWLARGGAPVATPLAGATFVTTEHPQRVTLADGSELVVAPASRVRSCEGEDACFVLERGAAEFEVTPRGDRPPFVVRAGDVSVTVVGTRFTVTERERDGRRETAVEVARGAVEVRVGDGAPRRLEAGERFVMAFGEPEPEPTSEPTSAVAPEPVPTEEATEAPTTAAHESEREPARTESEDETPADRLFAEARAARVEGDSAAAAHAYAELLERFPRDPRAGLVAFELGRLRQDALHDPHGAIAPLTRALESASHREDALARLARAHDAAGDRARCLEARGRYLAEYTDGAHAAAVRALCP